MKQAIYNTALYLRLSHDDEQQGESVSIQTQRTMLQTYARDHNLHVVGEYVDDGITGMTMKRLGSQKMVRAV